MEATKTYDKVYWHFPEGEGCPDIHTAKIHLEAVMRWLKENNLLTSEGVEALDFGIDSDFALTGHMLNEKGRQLLDMCYGEWLNSVNYGENPSMAYLDRCLKKL